MIWVQTFYGWKWAYIIWMLCLHIACRGNSVWNEKKISKNWWLGWWWWWWKARRGPMTEQNIAYLSVCVFSVCVFVWYFDSSFQYLSIFFILFISWVNFRVFDVAEANINNIWKWIYVYKMRICVCVRHRLSNKAQHPVRNFFPCLPCVGVQFDMDFFFSLYSLPNTIIVYVRPICLACYIIPHYNSIWILIFLCWASPSPTEHTEQRNENIILWW